MLGNALHERGQVGWRSLPPSRQRRRSMPEFRPQAQASCGARMFDRFEMSTPRWARHGLSRCQSGTPNSGSARSVSGRAAGACRIRIRRSGLDADFHEPCFGGRSSTTPASSGQSGARGTRPSERFWLPPASLLRLLRGLRATLLFGSKMETGATPGLRRAPHQTEGGRQNSRQNSVAMPAGISEPVRARKLPLHSH